MNEKFTPEHWKVIQKLVKVKVNGVALLVLFHLSQNKLLFASQTQSFGETSVDEATCDARDRLIILFSNTNIDKESSKRL